MQIVPLRTMCKCLDLRVMLLGGAGNLEETGPTGVSQATGACSQNARVPVFLISSAPIILLCNLALVRGPKHQMAN